jgi:hypothetical protein
MAVGISSVEVVPFRLVQILHLEQVEMGATSTVRNPQPYSLATEQKDYQFFR